MNLFSRGTDYAIRALVYMARSEKECVSTADLDRNLALPRPFMRKTLQFLQKAGYLVSVKGNRGGFRLTMTPEKVFLYDVMTAIQGRVSLGDCFFKKKVCHCVKTCPVRKEVKKMEEMLRVRLRSIAIADLLRG